MSNQEIEKPKLTKDEVKVLTYTEQVFWETGLLPTAEKVADALGIDVLVVRRANRNETLRCALARRGIDLDLTVTRTGKALLPVQIIAANMMLNLMDKRSVREKLEEIKISQQQFNAWMRQPQFQEFMRRRSEALFSSSDHVAYRALLENVADNDNKALEMFFTMRGKLRTQVDVNINVDVVVRQLVEIITKHVKDPVILEAIASEIEELDVIPGQKELANGAG